MMKNKRNTKLEQKVVNLRKTGLKFRLIGQMLGLTKQRVHAIYYRWKMEQKNLIVKPSNRRIISEAELANSRLVNDILRIIDSPKKKPLIDTLENGVDIFKPVKRRYD